MNSKILLILVVLISVSCSNSKKDILTNKWKVVKMTRNSRTIEINNAMSYDFKDDNRVIIITQNGSEVQGKWTMKNDSVLIQVKEETKGFSISTLNAHSATLKSGEFTFELEN